MNKKTAALLTILCLMIAFMDISGLPGVLLEIRIADVDPYIVPLLVNFLLIGLLAIAVIKLFRIDYAFGFSAHGVGEGLRKYAMPGIIVGVLSFAAFFIGLYPFDYHPTIWKILIEGILYYVGVRIVEEFYVRGLFLNIVEALFQEKKHKTEIAIIVSSVAFGLGHIPGVIGMGMGVIAFKLISTIGMGFYFGITYKLSKNLWVPMIMHSLIDICALPYCFTQNMRYEPISIIMLVIIYTTLAVYCVAVLFRQKAEKA